jgi:para-nitrobenzyl esterase
MIGNTDTEGTLWFLRDLRNFRVTEDQVKARIKHFFKIADAPAEALIKAYREDDPHRTPADILAVIASEMVVRAPVIRTAESRSRLNAAPTYLYHFRWHAPVDEGVWRSPHAVDLPFAFGNLDRATAITGTSPEAAEVSQNVMKAFVAFARNGDPNGLGLPEWKPYDTETRNTMVFDVNTEAVNDFRRGDRVASAPLAKAEVATVLRSALFRYSE